MSSIFACIYIELRYYPQSPVHTLYLYNVQSQQYWISCGSTLIRLTSKIFGQTYPPPPPPFQLVLGIMQCGFITIFLSTALVSGYTTGAAIHVFSSQLKHITGINIPRTPGVLSVPKVWVPHMYTYIHVRWVNACNKHPPTPLLAWK